MVCADHSVRILAVCHAGAVDRGRTPAFRDFLNGITFDLATTDPLVFASAYVGLGFV
ncbi:hypothetical protein ILFOPFJJ_06531 [Ensifer psoraleae]|nr:hypothetical protein [Sinorhizobium psoraleae]